MNKLKNVFRSPVALGGLIAGAIVFAVAAAGIVTASLSQAQEGPTSTATQDNTATPDAIDDAPTATEPSDGAGTPSGDEDTPSADKESLRDRFLDRLADELGISRDELNQALRNVGLDLVDQALADGRITEDEAARLRDAIENGNLPFFHGPRFHRGHGGFVFGATIEDVADFLGIDHQVVIGGLQDGQSLAQIAEANGSSRDALKDHLMQRVTDRANEALQNDRIDQEQADRILERASECIDELIDREGLPKRGLPFDGPNMEFEFTPGDRPLVPGGSGLFTEPNF